MHINFRKLTLHNFLSFGHSTIEFEDDGFIRVTGINENPDDLAVSNGSGKSSLWEAIVWALTGDTIRGTKQVANIYGEDGTYVELEFDIDSNHYNILRSKDHKEYKTNIRIMIDGKDCSGKGIRDSEKLLTQYLPDITSSLLGSVIILGQGLPQRFTNNSPSGRKEVLEKLSKSDFMIEDLKSRVTKRRMDLHKTIREIEDAILASNTTKNYLNEQIQVSQKALESLDGSDLQRQLNNAQSELSVYQSEKENAQSNADATQTSINDISQQLQQLAESKHQHEMEVEAEYKERLTEAEFTASRLNAERNSKAREITRIENIKDICPTCGQKLPDVHKPDTTELRNELAQLEVDYKNAEEARLALKKEQDTKLGLISSEFVTKKLELTSSLAEAVKLSEGYRGAVRDADLKITVANSKISEFERLLAQLETTIQNYQQTIENNSSKIRELDEQLMYNNSEKDLQQAHLDVVNKFETALKRDFRGFLLSTIIEYIQSRAKIYSEVIFETDKVGFCLDGNNIDITYLEKAYENLSGGEKQKIDLIIQFSIRDMLCNHLGFTSNILVLDEVFDGLDMIGCQRVLDVISSLNDIKNIFIVTHRKDLSIPTDKEIVVVKSASGISEIR
jgi:DNA repair exonuclease SbcCD ATPase subunit